MSDFGRELLACAVEGTDPEEKPLRHVADLPPRQARPQAWPHWADPDVVRAFMIVESTAPWSHQFEAADLAHDGRHVVLSTGTASGKSLAYQLPILTAFATDPRARALYLSPTKALGHDQLRTAHALTDAVGKLGDGRTQRLRRRQPERGTAIRPRTVALDLLQSRHDPSVAVAQPRAMGGVPAQSSLYRRRRMPLLPWRFRLERGDGAAPPAAAVHALFGACRRSSSPARRRRHRRPPPRS